MSQVWAIAANTFREAIRNRILYAFLFFSFLFIGAATLMSHLTVGEYSNPRRLAKPDSYEFEDVDGAIDFDPASIGDYDFEYASVNVNAVMRWEYRPGSTIYLVWAHSRSSYEQRDFLSDPASFELDLRVHTGLLNRTAINHSGVRLFHERRT